MKKFLLALLIVITVFTASVLPASASEDISVTFNGNYLNFDVEPQIIDGRVMVPMRTIFESFGAKVKWDNKDTKITATKGDTTIVMYVGSRTMRVNDKTVRLDVAPQIVDGRTLVPVRAISEALNATVIWESEISTVIISDSKKFNSTSEAFDYLWSWILENGTAYADSVKLTWDLDLYEKIEIKKWEDHIIFSYSTYDTSNKITSLTSLYVNSYDNNVYYISGEHNSQISGYINKFTHSDKYPLSFDGNDKRFNAGDYTVLTLVEMTRKRINYALNKSNSLLGLSGARVTLKDIGFINY